MLSYDINTYPYVVQYYTQGWFQNYFSIQHVISIELISRRIVRYKTDKYNKKTEIVSRRINNEAFSELLSFFSFEAILDFQEPEEGMAAKTWRGYYDCAYRECIIFAPNIGLAEIRIGWIYSDDPVAMADDWVERWFPDL